jgi:probable phosphoglycerate mutase
MTTFYLIRHGETDWNVSGRWQGHTDIPLNDVGRAQAARLAERLRDHGPRFDALYSSDLLRAWETAQFAGRAIGMQPQPMPALREIDLGTWSGLTRAEIMERDLDTLAQVDAGVDLPRGGAERFADLVARVSAAAEQLATKHHGQHVALVTHGGVVRALLQHAAPDAHAWHAHIGNTSITIVVYNQQGWDVVSVNDMAHLEGSPQALDLMSAPPDDAQQA